MLVIFYQHFIYYYVMIIPEYEQIKHHATEKYCENNFPEFHKYINEKYINFNISFKEKLYWYYNGLTCYPTCKICGNRVNFHRFCNGYYSTCSSRCANIISREKAKQTCLERYGVEHPKKSSVVNEKTKQTCLERYGVSSFTQSNQFKEKTKQTCVEKYGTEYYLQSDDYNIKNRSTRLKRYGDENYRNSEKAKHTCLERYGVENPGCRDVQKINNTINKDIIQQKIYQTKKKNKTFNSSKIEKQFEAYLKENNINYKTQYKSKVYPFNCDFYFPDNDLYLEINAHWTHGGHPFDSTNKDDLLLLEQWKSKNTGFYNNAVIVWTVRDVLKRDTAKKNNLNYLEVFTDNIEDLINKIFNI